jgi:hypothetical protein
MGEPVLENWRSRGLNLLLDKPAGIFPPIPINVLDNEVVHLVKAVDQDVKELVLDFFAELGR